MKPLAAHAALLAEALNGIDEDNYEARDISSYLKMAAGIRRVEFDTSAFDPLGGFCETADDYFQEQDKLWGTLATSISIFLFTWAAVEAYKDEIQLPDPPATPGKKKRQIDRLCYLLSSEYKYPLPEKYEETVASFRAAAGHAEIGRGVVVSTRFPTYMRPVAVGLYLVYELRNAFAHGNFSAPAPDADESPDTHPDIVLVALATRLVLMSIQMITLCVYPADKPVEMPSKYAFLDQNPLTVANAFLRLHLKSFRGGTASMPLFGQ